MSGAQWFALAVGLALLGGNVWLWLREPRWRGAAVAFGAGGFQVAWAALFHERGGLWEAPIYAAPVVVVAAFVWEVRRSRRRRARRPPPGSAPPSPGP